jgi:hypothetical protein
VAGIPAQIAPGEKKRAGAVPARRKTGRQRRPRWHASRRRDERAHTLKWQSLRAVIAQRLSAALLDWEEQWWITSETVLDLPGSAMVKVELLDGPSAAAPLPRRARPRFKFKAR